MSWKSLAPYIDTLLPLVHEQYKTATNLLSIIEELGRQGDVLDAISQELYTIFDLELATGATLDILGRLANVARLGLADVQYRNAIRTVLGTQRSGTPEDIISTIKRVTGAASVEYIPAYPAGYWVIPSSGGDKITQQLLDSLSPAGVQGYPPCFLVDARGAAIVDAHLSYILVVGPCTDVGAAEPYTIFDGGVGGGADFTTFDIVDGGVGDAAPIDVIYDFAGGP